MPKSVTRWNLSAQELLYIPCLEALEPYILADQLIAIPELIYGPMNDIPDGQYECHRTWTTVALAQNWIDTIDSISAPLGFVAISKRVIE
jgi:hypothetical protein